MNFKKYFSLFLLISLTLSTFIYSQTLQWRTLPNSPNNSGSRFEDIYFLNPFTGWVADYTGVVYKTTNAGENWDTVFKSISLEFRSIGFFDSQNGVLGTLFNDTNRILFRTTNGGFTWTALTDLPNPKPRGICGISIVNENLAYACGRWDSPGRIIKTTNKGLSWISIPVDTSLANSFVDVYFRSPDSGIVVGGYQIPGGRACILKTTNGGTTWARVYLSTRTNEFCWKVSFVNTNLGYASIQRNGFAYYLKTTDGGMTWEDKSFRNYVEQGIGFINENTGWIGGWGGPTYETTDAGGSWHLAGYGRNINRFRFINDTLAYAVGERVYKYSRETVGINLTSNDIPSSFMLYQNYPNPFNPVTRIKFDIPSNVKGGVPSGSMSNVKLIVYDALGKEVATLINQKLSQGTYEVDFDGSNFSSGIYFYKIYSGDPSTSSGQVFNEVKRMILLR